MIKLYYEPISKHGLNWYLVDAKGTLSYYSNHHRRWVPSTYTFETYPRPLLLVGNNARFHA